MPRLRQFDGSVDVRLLGLSIVMTARARPGTSEVEPEHCVPPVLEPSGDSDHQRGIHRTAVERMRMTEHREALRRVRGINPGFQGCTV